MKKDQAIILAFKHLNRTKGKESYSYEEVANVVLENNWYETNKHDMTDPVASGVQNLEGEGTLVKIGEVPQPNTQGPNPGKYNLRNRDEKPDLKHEPHEDLVASATSRKEDWAEIMVFDRGTYFEIVKDDPWGYVYFMEDHKNSEHQAKIGEVSNRGRTPDDRLRDFRNTVRLKHTVPMSRHMESKLHCMFRGLRQIKNPGIGDGRESEGRFISEWFMASRRLRNFVDAEIRLRDQVMALYEEYDESTVNKREVLNDDRFDMIDCEVQRPHGSHVRELLEEQPSDSEDISLEIGGSSLRCSRASSMYEDPVKRV